MAFMVWLALFLFGASGHAEWAGEVINRGTPFNGQFDEQCTTWTKGEPTEGQKKVIGKVMGQRDHRLWHFMWHSMPRSWHKFGEAEKKFFTELSPDWVPPQVGGIDFFYMHHIMIKMLFQAFKDAGQPCMEPWIQLPRQDEWPPWPEGYDAKKFAQMEKTRDFVLNKDNLKGKSLQELGRLLEPTLHGEMHVNYSIKDRLPKYKDCAYNTAMLMAAPATAAYKAECDHPENDFLKGTETAHVNPIFYKLHGMVEWILIEWAMANGYTGGVADEAGGNCGKRQGKCYDFKSDIGKAGLRAPWLGGTPGTHGETKPTRGHEHHTKGKNFVQSGIDRMTNTRYQKNWREEWRKNLTKPTHQRQRKEVVGRNLMARTRNEVKAEVEKKLPKLLKVMHQFSQMGDGISLLSPEN